MGPGSAELLYHRPSCTTANYIAFGQQSRCKWVQPSLRTNQGSGSHLDWQQFCTPNKADCCMSLKCHWWPFWSQCNLSQAQKTLCVERDESWGGLLHQTVQDLPACKTLTYSPSWIVATPTNPNWCLEGFVYGLHWRVTKIRRLLYHSGNSR